MTQRTKNERFLLFEVFYTVDGIEKSCKVRAESQLNAIARFGVYRTWQEAQPNAFVVRVEGPLESNT